MVRINRPEAGEWGGVTRGVADHSSAAKAEDEVEGRFSEDVVIAQGAAVLELLAGKEEPLLVARHPLHKVNHPLHLFDCVRVVHLPGE